MRIPGRKEKTEEEVIGRFFQPQDSEKTALMLLVSLGLALLFLIGGLYLYFHLPYGFPPSLFIFLLVFLAGLSSAVGLHILNKAKIGNWFIVSKGGIRRGKRFMPWEKIKTIVYLMGQSAGSGLDSVPSYKIPNGIYLSAISPQDLREQLSDRKYQLPALFKMIKANIFVVPLDVEDLPQLVRFILEFAPSALRDMESFLISQLAYEDSFLADPSDLFQTQIYEGQSVIPALHNFFTGIKYLLQLKLKEAEQHLKEAYEEGEVQARPYLSLALFLQGKYEECVSRLKNVSLPLNKGEQLILLSSLLKLGKWGDVEQTLKGAEDEGEFYYLGVLCALGKWKELISLGEKISRRSDDIALNLCLNCAEKLSSQRAVSLVSLSPPTSPKVSWKYYLLSTLGFLSLIAFSLFEGWIKGAGIGSIFIIVAILLESLQRNYMLKEAYAPWAFFLQQKLASPFWCSLAFLSSIKEQRKEEPV